CACPTCATSSSAWGSTRSATAPSRWPSGSARSSLATARSCGRRTSRRNERALVAVREDSAHAPIGAARGKALHGVGLQLPIRVQLVRDEERPFAHVAA